MCARGCAPDAVTRVHVPIGTRRPATFESAPRSALMYPGHWPLPSLVTPMSAVAAWAGSPSAGSRPASPTKSAAPPPLTNASRVASIRRFSAVGSGRMSNRSCPRSPASTPPGSTNSHSTCSRVSALHQAFIARESPALPSARRTPVRAKGPSTSSLDSSPRNCRSSSPNACSPDSSPGGIGAMRQTHGLHPAASTVAAFSFSSAAGQATLR